MATLDLPVSNPWLTMSILMNEVRITEIKERYKSRVEKERDEGVMGH